MMRPHWHIKGCTCMQCQSAEHKPGCICNDCMDPPVATAFHDVATCECSLCRAMREYAAAVERPMREYAAAVERPKDDPVNHPPHYTAGGIECIDAIKAALTEEEFRGFCKGNALKYVWRERHKGGTESLAKAGWYLNWINQ